MKPISAGALDTPPAKLIVLDGPDRGKIFDLDDRRQYLLGRSEECDIRIDISDKTVSRKHAMVTLEGNTIKIQNLSQTNPVQVKGKPINHTILKHKGQFQIGAGLFAFEGSGIQHSGAGAPAPNWKIIVPVALTIIVIGSLYIALSGKNGRLDSVDLDMTRSSASHHPDDTQTMDSLSDDPSRGIGLSVSAADREMAESHFRKGMFFYDTDNLGRAVEEWNRTIALYPDHQEAMTWYLRAEKELEDKVKEHYQTAMTHYKYMRYHEAALEFRSVVELSRDKTSDQYLNAQRHLNEIQGK